MEENSTIKISITSLRELSDKLGIPEKTMLSVYDKDNSTIDSEKFGILLEQIVQKRINETANQPYKDDNTELEKAKETYKDNKKEINELSKKGVDARITQPLQKQNENIGNDLNEIEAKKNKKGLNTGDRKKIKFLNSMLKGVSTLTHAAKNITKGMGVGVEYLYFKPLAQISIKLNENNAIQNGISKKRYELRLEKLHGKYDSKARRRAMKINKRNGVKYGDPNYKEFVYTRREANRFKIADSKRIQYEKKETKYYKLAEDERKNINMMRDDVINLFKTAFNPNEQDKSVHENQQPKEQPVQKQSVSEQIKPNDVNQEKQNQTESNKNTNTQKEQKFDMQISLSNKQIDQLNNLSEKKKKDVIKIIADKTKTDIILDKETKTYTVAGKDKDSVERAINNIKLLSCEFKKNDRMDGQIVGFTKRGDGAFVNIAPGRDVYINTKYLPEDAKRGDIIEIQCTSDINKNGNQYFTAKDIDKSIEKYAFLKDEAVTQKTSNITINNKIIDALGFDETKVKANEKELLKFEKLCNDTQITDIEPEKLKMVYELTMGVDESNCVSAEMVANLAKKEINATELATAVDTARVTNSTEMLDYIKKDTDLDQFVALGDVVMARDLSGYELDMYKVSKLSEAQLEQITEALSNPEISNDTVNKMIDDYEQNPDKIEPAVLHSYDMENANEVREESKEVISDDYFAADTTNMPNFAEEISPQAKAIMDTGDLSPEHAQLILDNPTIRDHFTQIDDDGSLCYCAETGDDNFRQNLITVIRDNPEVIENVGMYNNDEKFMRDCYETNPECIEYMTNSDIVANIISGNDEHTIKEDNTKESIKTTETIEKTEETIEKNEEISSDESNHSFKNKVKNSIDTYDKENTNKGKIEKTTNKTERSDNVPVR